MAKRGGTWQKKQGAGTRPATAGVGPVELDAADEDFLAELAQKALARDLDFDLDEEREKSAGSALVLTVTFCKYAGIENSSNLVGNVLAVNSPSPSF